MKCQNLFSRKNNMNLSSAELAKRVVKVNSSNLDCPNKRSWLECTQYFAIPSCYRIYPKYSQYSHALLQLAHNVETKSIQRWFNVLTLNQRLVDVFTKLCACWDYFTHQQLSRHTTPKQCRFNVDSTSGCWIDVVSSCVPAGMYLCV